jgi:hypothetical protein
MSKTRAAAPIISALLLATTAATAPYTLAQTPPDTAATPAPAPPAAGAPGTAPSSAGDPAKSSAAKSAPGDDSPFDYRSSEKISEDLSVSFPVDI